ncbi:unnamed protein product [Sphenostylis stenocarpa]|uniref:Transmembrane protein n=1 Tax=Sphenostylis stenocarpa TaxID=92480 RepID=A0AA86RYW2_9FABA|nr:unnamed protein product [Sphenostylis stenocarpa]
MAMFEEMVRNLCKRMDVHEHEWMGWDGMGWAWEANLKRESKEIGLSLPPLSPTCPRYDQLGKFARFGMKSGRILLCGMGILVGLISMQSSSSPSPSSNLVFLS